MTNSVAFVFASKAEQNAEQIINKYLKNEIPYDILYLSESKKPKILKADVDLDLGILDKYSVVCPIGAEALKYAAGLTGVQKYNGVLIENKYMPIMHPNITIIKPQLEEDIVKAFSNLDKVFNNESLHTTVEKDYCFIQTDEQFFQYNEEIEKAFDIVVDIETSSLSPRNGNTLGIVISTKPHQGLYFSKDIVHKHKDWFHNIFKTKKCIFHNAKFDIGFLRYEFGFEFPDFEDTMLLHYCLNEAVGTHGLKQLALAYTDLGDYERELNDYKKTFCRQNKIKVADFNYGMLPDEILAPYGCKDGDASFQLYLKFKPLVYNNDKFKELYETILKPATEALMLLENNGGPIDRDQVIYLSEQYQIDAEECYEEISMYPAVKTFERIYQKEFNPNSTAQLREVFFNILKLPSTKKTETGAASVDKSVLEELDHPIAAAVLDLRSKTKMAGTYINSILRGIDKDNRLRSGFNIHGTTSGRLSSSGNLNYQNIPRDNKDIKKLFVARPGYKIVQCDLGTAEVYYAAVLSKDKFLQQAFIDKLDFHSYVAKQMFNLPCEVNQVKEYYPNERQYSKAIK